MKTKGSIRMKTGVFIVTVLFLCAVPDSALSQPANDNFADAIELTGISGKCPLSA